MAINLPYAVSDDDLPVTIIALSELTVPADTVIRFVGVRPITLVVDGQVRIDGVLDASSRADDPVVGAGSAIGSCSNQGDADDERYQSGGGGGGGGGSLRYNGGRGGTGDGGEAEGAPAGTIPQWPGALRGGCPGGLGAVANGRDISDSAAGGAGGGGLRLVASGDILVNGIIDASGAGGGGSHGKFSGADDGLPGTNNEGGGGGGGSPGFVIVEADSYSARDDATSPPATTLDDVD